jgi:hypothetical protein
VREFDWKEGLLRPLVRFDTEGINLKLFKLCAGPDGIDVSTSPLLVGNNPTHFINRGRFFVSFSMEFVGRLSQLPSGPLAIVFPAV